MMKIFWKLIVFMTLLTMTISLYANSESRFSAGVEHQAVVDLNTSALVWEGSGPSVNAAWQMTLRSGMRYQVDLSFATVQFKPSTLNYFYLSSSTTLGMMTRFLEPVSVGPSLTFLAGGGFSSPILAIRHSNLWSMNTVIEGSLDLTANTGLEFKRGPWEASMMLDLPVASLALVQDYSASGNHLIRFASFHNSFQLFGKATCLYRIGKRSQIGLEADYAHRSMRVIKRVDSWAYGLNLVYRIQW
jgi:hypothetical protein